MFDWIKKLFHKEEKLDELAGRISQLYQGLKFYYLSNDIKDPDFKVKWNLKDQTLTGETGIAELKFNSLLAPVYLSIILDQNVGSDPKSWKLDYTLTYESKDTNEGFQIAVKNGETIMIDTDFNPDEIDLALFEIEEYLRDATLY